MARVYVDRVLQLSISSGTGNFLMTGTITGYSTFDDACAVDDTFDYAIVSVDDANVPNGIWETGRGRYVSEGVIERTTVQDSSTGSRIDFPDGTKQVMLSQNAASIAEGGTGGGGGGGTPPETHAFVSFGGNPATIHKSYNVASVVRTSAGRSRVTFATPFDDTEYLVTGGGFFGPFNDTNFVVVGVDRQGQKATTHCDLIVEEKNSSSIGDFDVVVGFQQFDPTTGLGGGGGGGGGGNNFAPCAVIQHAVADADVGSATANLATAPTAGNFIILVSTGWQATKTWSPAGFATVCAQYVANNSTQIALKRADGTEGTQFKSFGSDRNNLTVYEVEPIDAIGVGGGALSVQGNTWIIPAFPLNGQPSTTFIGIETDNFSALSYTDGPAAIISDYIQGGNHSGLHFVVEQDAFTEFKGQMASVNNPIGGYLQIAKRI